MIETDPSPSEDPGEAKLPRTIGATTALCVVVGSVIGSGIFLVPAGVAKAVPNIAGIVALWIVGGLFSLAGALTLAELAAMLPRAGGPYVYLREAYGRLPAFLFGWTEFLIIRAGSVATLAAAFAIYAAQPQLFPAPKGMDSRLWQMILACAAMTAVAVINVIGTKASGTVQVVGTVLKLGALAAMMVLPFVLGKAHASNLSPVWPARVDREPLHRVHGGDRRGPLGLRRLGQRREPRRGDPRPRPQRPAGAGAGHADPDRRLPRDDARLPPRPADGHDRGGLPGRRAPATRSPRSSATPCWATGGRWPSRWSSSARRLISLNGNALSGPRAYFAMARDGLFPRILCKVHPRFQTPANAIIAQAVWSIALTVAATAFLLVEPPEIRRLCRGSSITPGRNSTRSRFMTSCSLT